MSTPTFSQAQEHFRTADPGLAAVMEKLSPFTLSELPDPFHDLCETVIGQQLSGSVARVLCSRFRQALGVFPATPHHILQHPPEFYREQGMAWAKARTLIALAQASQAGSLVLDAQTLNTKTDAEILHELTAIKGIGPWTAEMFLMFTLGRPDVFSAGDLGLAKGLQKLDGLADLPEKTYRLQRSAVWAPYRSYASRVLWALLDTPGL